MIRTSIFPCSAPATIERPSVGIRVRNALRFVYHVIPNREITRPQLYLLVALVTGLMTFPTICNSGAEVPHPHALFMLAHHHHDETGEVDWTPTSRADGTNTSSRSALDSPSAQPVTQSFMNSDQVVATAAIHVTFTTSGSLGPLSAIRSGPNGSDREAPEPPPPRI